MPSRAVCLFGLGCQGTVCEGSASLVHHFVHIMTDRWHKNLLDDLLATLTLLL